MLSLCSLIYDKKHLGETTEKQQIITKVDYVFFLKKTLVRLKCEKRNDSLGNVKFPNPD